jgi:hypothetical protein
MGRWVVPGRIPRSFLVVEGIRVGPILAAFAIWEVAIGASHSDIKNQIEFSIKWGGVLGFVLPWIVRGLGELTLGPQILVKWEVQHCLVVDSGDDMILCPLKLVDVERVVQSTVWQLVSGSRLPIWVLWPIWSPMESGAERLGSSNRTVKVTSRFDDVDLTRSWPWSIGIVNWHHPDSWPNPISFGQFSSNLNSTILEPERFE